MKLPNGQNLVNIVRETLNRVDPRLVDHGERVAYLVYKMLQAEGESTPQVLRDSSLAALFHDVGAYKTEEIDRMAQFETGDTWEHSVYGYLFLRYMSPLKDYAPSILLHHVPYFRLRDLDVRHKKLTGLIHLADRLDVLLQVERRAFPEDFWERARRDECFSPLAIDLMYRAMKLWDIAGLMDSGAYRTELSELLVKVPFTREEIDVYLRMLVFAIDFRSHHTDTHTITTESASVEIATLLGALPDEIMLVRYGALLHDLGKIAIPVEILEFPGKLSPQAMTVMRTHVEITGNILGDEIDSEIVQIALRHHEKLDGSGYPLGLTGDVLTSAQRIVAVADVLSALHGTRSYKAAFGKEKIRTILGEMKRDNKLCPQVVDLVCGYYDEIMGNVAENCTAVLDMYNHIQEEYEELLARCMEL